MSRAGVNKTPGKGPDTEARSNRRAARLDSSAVGAMLCATPFSLTGVQTKVVMGRVNDPYEKQADAVAATISRGGRVDPGTVTRLAPGALQPIQRSVADSAGDAQDEPIQAQVIQRQAEPEEVEGDEPVQALAIQREAESEEDGGEEPVQAAAIQREAEGEEEVGEDSVQAKSAASPTRPMAAVASSAIARRGPGSSLPKSTRSVLERGLGTDLRDVRVHSGPDAQDAAAGLKARAFTHGRDIWLGKGESADDVPLMAHEVTHVLQQGGAVRRKPVEDDAVDDDEDRPTRIGGSESEGAQDADQDSEAAAGRTSPDQLPGTADEPAADVQGVLARSGAAVGASSEVGEASGGSGRTTREAGPQPGSAVPDQAAAIDRLAQDPAGESDVAADQADALSAAGQNREPAGIGQDTEAGAPTRPASTEASAEPSASSGPGSEATTAGAGQAAESQTVGEDGQGEPTAESSGEQADAEPEAGPEKAPEPDPSADPEFQERMKNLGRLAKREKKHALPGAEVVAAEVSTRQPEEEPKALGMVAHTKKMDSAAASAKPPPTEEPSFLSMLQQALEDLLPTEPVALMEFGKTGAGGDKLRSKVRGGVEGQKAQSTKPIVDKVQEAPTPEGAEPHVELAKDPASGKLLRVGADGALPQPKTDAEVSRDEDKQEADQELAKTGLSEKELRGANEKEFSEVVDAKNEVHTSADAAPARYRAKEAEFLSTARKDARREENQVRHGMRGVREDRVKGKRGKQTALQRRRAEERARVAGVIKKRFADAKRDVNRKLKKLDRTVNNRFAGGHLRAFSNLKHGIRTRMERWKDRRYSGARGKLRWVADRFRDINKLSGAKRIYTEERDKYKDAMKDVFRRIARDVELGLKDCKNDIQTARKDVADYVATLKSKTLKEYATTASNEIEGEFDALERSVVDKKRQLATKLANKYVESRKKVDKWIEAEKARNRSLLVKLANKVRGVVATIRRLKNQLMNTLRRARSVIMTIIRDPIGFLGNLLRAVKQGFNQFRERIGEHLKNGLMGWVFGTLSKAGIELPKDFTPRSVFGLVLQILGVTRERIRAKVVKQVGERSVAMVERVWGAVSRLMTDGPRGLWEQAKESLGNLKERILDELKGFVITEIVKAAVKKLVSMFNPVGAFIQAALTIYRTVRFFIERIEQIMRVVQSIISSVVDVAKGRLEAAANAVERAMAGTIPLVISFLARLMGLGGIAGKIQSTIKGIRRPVDRALDKVIAKIAKGIGKIAGGLRAGGKAVVTKVKGMLFPRRRFKMGGETHTIAAEDRGGGRYDIVMRSRPRSLAKFIRDARKQIGKDESLGRKRTRRRKAVTTVLGHIEQNEKVWKRAKTGTEAEKKEKEKLYAEISRDVIDVAAVLGSPDKEPRPSNPVWSRDSRGRAKSVVVKPLTRVGKGGGNVADEGQPSTRNKDHIKGWTSGADAQTHSRIRAHLLHHKLGGPANSANLTPTSNTTNRLMFTRVERQALLAVKQHRELKYETHITYESRPVEGYKHVAKRVEMTAVDITDGANVNIGKLAVDNY